MKILSIVTSGVAVLLSSQVAVAQGVSASADASAGTEVEEEAGAEAEAEAEPTPVAEPEPQPVANESEKGAPEAEVDGDSDHDKVLKRLAVGYLGRQTLHYGAGGVVPAYVEVVAPVIGVRYWFTDMVGLDAGVGFNFLGGKTKVTDVDDVKAAGHQAFLLHAGVPLNLADRGHFSFQVVPEANFGLVGTGDQDGDPDDNIEIHSSGTFFNVGARAGAEIHFGFMNIPELSLQGSIGAYLQMETVRTKFDDDGDVITASTSTTQLASTLGSDPWDVFTSSISALYYF